MYGDVDLVYDVDVDVYACDVYLEKMIHKYGLSANAWIVW